MPLDILGNTRVTISFSVMSRWDPPKGSLVLNRDVLQGISALAVTLNPKEAFGRDCGL